MELVLVGTEDCHCHTTHAADGCTHPEEIYEWQSVPCNSGGGSSSSGTSSGGTNNTGAGGGSIGGSNTNENGVATSLTNTDGSLTETQNLINQINGILTGNDSFKINTNLNTLAQFNSVSDFSSFLNNFNNTFSISGYELTNNQNGTKTTKFKGQFTNSMILPVYLNVHVTSKLDDPNTNQNEFSLESVNSFKTGSMPFTNWVQDSYFYNYSGSYTTVTINGHFDFGISIGNLHLTYTESWIVKVFFNNITGNAINMTVTKE
ncbi:hypothetical protein [Tenacibaculum xiamenense]|uniref:hypothetical protein n=1 Tax=Tenacibaculum xiamenense TaxID=1261553 RepID=UPI0038946CF0